MVYEKNGPSHVFHGWFSIQGCQMLIEGNFYNIPVERNLWHVTQRLGRSMAPLSKITDNTDGLALLPQIQQLSDASVVATKTFALLTLDYIVIIWSHLQYYQHTSLNFSWFIEQQPLLFQNSSLLNKKLRYHLKLLPLSIREIDRVWCKYSRGLIGSLAHPWINSPNCGILLWRSNIHFMERFYGRWLTWPFYIYHFF